MFNNIKQDIKRYIVIEEAFTFRKKIDMFLYNYSLWVIVSYRFGRWVRTEFRIPLLKIIFKTISKLLHSLLGVLTSIQIPFGTKIGPGLYIGHTGLLVINEEAVIGSNCNISVGVVIGQGGRGANRGSPIIGNNVFIGVGAKLIGRIKVGNWVAIGANAVVTNSVPDGVTVAGIPARIINSKGSGDFMRGE